MPRQTIRWQRLIRCSLVAAVFLLISSISQANEWQKLAPGIEYQDIGSSLFNPWSHIHVFRVDPKLNQFDILLAKNLSQQSASIDEFARHGKALIALNGGFFDRSYHPLGLRLSDHQQQNPLKRISWWGVFYISDDTPRLSTYRQFRKDKHVDFALQSGPRLLADGKTISLKPGVAERSALGITKDNKVIILVTDNTPMSTTTLAGIMESSPLYCTDALNLDGGSSTQLKATIDSFQVSVHGFSKISDAIIVRPRN